MTEPRTSSQQSGMGISWLVQGMIDGGEIGLVTVLSM
jgi:hypothetical protein